MPITVKAKGVTGISQSLTVAEVAATTVADQTFTVGGLNVGDIVHVTPPALTAGLLVTSAYVSAANTLSIRFYNTTGAPITLGATTWGIMAVQRD